VRDRSGDDHHRRDDGRRERRGEADGQQQAAADLGAAGQDGVPTPRPEADRFEPARRAGEAGAAEPSEQLLRTVRRERQTNRDPKKENAEFHHFTSLIDRRFMHALQRSTAPAVCGVGRRCTRPVD
jgi:hypothetical protein